jgi:DNA-binding transcriptional regulator YiaG
MARGRAASASAAEGYAPIHVICATNATARSLCAEQPQAKPAGSPDPRTRTTSAGPTTSPAIDYETFAKIHHCRDRQGLTATQIARALGLNRNTVAKWLARPRFASQQRCQPRSSILDPFVKDWRARHPGYWRKASRSLLRSKTSQ